MQVANRAAGDPRPVGSPAPVRAVAKQLDGRSRRSICRPLQDHHCIPGPERGGTPAQDWRRALARPVLVALGLSADAKKVIDFRLATAESAAQWQASWLIRCAAAA